MKSIRAALLVLLLSALAGGARGAVPERPGDPRVEALLGQMTLEEKIGQLNLVAAGPGLDPEAIRQGRVGAVMNFDTAPQVARAQALFAQSRLKIPPLIALDVVHGYRTLFPMPLAEAATFDPQLAFEASRLAAEEAAAAGVNWTFGPMADLSRDIRWGRIVEGAGEDVYLLSLFTAARVRGFHAGGLATATKHFVGYGAGVGGRDYDAAYIPPGTLRDLYLPPFQAAIEAGSEGVMSAFTALDESPINANQAVLTGVLRGELGFKGFVVSDYGAIEELVAHGVAEDVPAAVRQSFTAGVDMEMMSGNYSRRLADEVRAGRISEARLDESVRRILAIKLRLGLFEPSAPKPDTAAITQRARQGARKVAAESFVLLKNQGDLLPIAPSVRRIALIGSLAASRRDLNGPHEARGVEAETTTLVDGITERARTAGASVRYAPGCDLYCLDAGGFDAAVAAAAESDLVVAVMGEPRDLSGEAGSRARLTLPGRQSELLERLAATGKPVVLVIVAGRPVELGSALEQAESILMAWYPGTEGGHAIADVLFGDVSPSGKLPHTWPRTIGQVPIYYDRLPSGRPTRADNRFTLKYVDEEVTPQFPFGWGLSYTLFAYSDLQVLNPTATARDLIRVRVTLANVGTRPGKEAAQLYVRDPVASRSRPVRQLKGLQKVALEPGERRTLVFDLPACQLGFHQADGSYVVEPGLFELGVGGDSSAPLDARLELTQGLTLPAGQTPGLASDCKP